MLKQVQYPDWITEIPSGARGIPSAIVQSQVWTADAGELIFQRLLALWLLIAEGGFTFEHSHKADLPIILMGTL